jgi:arginine N-succinyltransferase
LVVLPESRRHPAQLGKLLFHVRFLYLALHRAIFRDDVLSELMPPLQPDGTSLLWEALGRRFTGLSYQEADRLSHENKEFIRALFPEEPIYATLLPKDVQAVIGEVGPETKGVERMLRRVGFSYAQRIDPFDGGPHFQTRIDDVTVVAAVKRALTVVAARQPPASGAPGVAPGARRLAQRVLVAVEDSDAAPSLPTFRAVSTTCDFDDHDVGLSEDARHTLRVDVGQTVAVLPLDQAAPLPTRA